MKFDIKAINLKSIQDRVIGAGSPGTIKGAMEAAGLAAVVPVYEAVTSADLSTDSGRVFLILAAWRLVYGLFRK